MNEPDVALTCAECRELSVRRPLVEADIRGGEAGSKLVQCRRTHPVDRGADQARRPVGQIAAPGATGHAYRLASPILLLSIGSAVPTRRQVPDQVVQFQIDGPHDEAPRRLAVGDYLTADRRGLG